MIRTSRFIVSIGFPLVVTITSYSKKSVNISGAVTGFLVTCLLSLANYCFLFDIFTFFITSSLATKYKQDLKVKIEENFKEGGQRSWVQVICNGGVATYLAVLYLLEVGSGEKAIDFVKDTTASCLSIGIMNVFAFGNADTWASELGTVIAKSKPHLITTWREVPPGTNGGITLDGTILSALGGLVVGLTHYVVLMCLVDSEVLAVAPPQWPILFFGALAGLLGSLLDSLLGASLQFSGIDKFGKIISNPNLCVQYICGSDILSNHNVNLVTTLIIGTLLPILCQHIWPN